MNKLIIAGGRDFSDRDLMIDRLKEMERLGLVTPQTLLLCGMARGADKMAHDIFTAAGLPIVEMPADWNGLGKVAGFARNNEMAQEANLALIFWDGQSKGTAHMIQAMRKLNKPVYLVNY